MRCEIEQDRFHRRISNRDPSSQKDLDVQWAAIKQIELRLFDLQDKLLAFERFDPNLMVKEVHEMTEALIKIQAGTFQADGLHFDSNVFIDSHDNGDYGDYGDDDYYGEDYSIEDHPVIQKQLSKKAGKVTNKQLSSILTAKVNKKR